MTAKDVGSHKLHLVIFAVVDNSMAELRSFDQPIVVNVTIGQKVARFVGGNWQWLWAVILAPLATFAYGLFKHKPVKAT